MIVIKNDTVDGGVEAQVTKDIYDTAELFIKGKGSSSILDRSDDPFVTSLSAPGGSYLTLTENCIISPLDPVYRKEDLGSIKTVRFIGQETKYIYTFFNITTDLAEFTLSLADRSTFKIQAGRRLCDLTEQTQIIVHDRNYLLQDAALLIDNERESKKLQVRYAEQAENKNAALVTLNEFSLVSKLDLPYAKVGTEQFNSFNINLIGEPEMAVPVQPEQRRRNFVWPCPSSTKNGGEPFYRETSQWGPRDGGIHGGADYRTLNEQKVAQPEIVVACEDAEIIELGQEAWGPFVRMKGLWSGAIIRYMHIGDGNGNVSNLVAVGQRVNAGDPVGKSDIGGLNRSHHLHFEVTTQSGANVDPIYYWKEYAPDIAANIDGHITLSYIHWTNKTGRPEADLFENIPGVNSTPQIASKEEQEANGEDFVNAGTPKQSVDPKQLSFGVKSPQEKAPRTDPNNNQQTASTESPTLSAKERSRRFGEQQNNT